jgi:flagellar motor switch/type III secretory pathway protein FliN
MNRPSKDEGEAGMPFPSTPARYTDGPNGGDADEEVEVRVEVGTVTLSLAAWHALKGGGVLRTEMPFGGELTLRTSSSEAGAAELCVINGKLAIRVIRR